MNKLKKFVMDHQEGVNGALVGFGTGLAIGAIVVARAASKGYQSTSAYEFKHEQTGSDVLAIKFANGMTQFMVRNPALES